MRTRSILGVRLAPLTLVPVAIVLASAALGWLGQGHWGTALAVYLLGLLGFSGSNIFYDALLVDVARPKDYERVSALGYALGYLGGGLLFAVNVLMTLYPEVFGLAGQAEAVQAAFLGVAIWWVLFTIPVALWVPDGKGSERPGARAALRKALGELAVTFRQIRALRETFLFLLAYWGADIPLGLQSSYTY